MFIFKFSRQVQNFGTRIRLRQHDFFFTGFNFPLFPHLYYHLLYWYFGWDGLWAVKLKTELLLIRSSCGEYVVSLCDFIISGWLWQSFFFLLIMLLQNLNVSVKKRGTNSLVRPTREVLINWVFAFGEDCSTLLSTILWIHDLIDVRLIWSVDILSLVSPGTSKKRKKGKSDGKKCISPVFRQCTLSIKCLQYSQEIHIILCSMFFFWFHINQLKCQHSYSAKMLICTQAVHLKASETVLWKNNTI